MRKYLTIFSGAIMLALLVAGCSLDTPSSVELPVAQPSGAAVFGNYVAAGNSLTAGFMDGGLIMNGQVNSFPQLIATQMGYPAGSFVQPLIASPGVGSSDVDEGVAGVLHFDSEGSLSLLGTTPLAGVPGLLLASAWPVPYSNLGVPGATTLDMSQALGAATSQAGDNSFFDLILRNPNFGNVAMVDQLIARGPTLATLWIGNNDILGGATSGDPVLGVNLTPSAAFGAMYTSLLDGVLDGVMDRHGFRPLLFVANIPSISSIPYFMPTAMFRQVAGLPSADDLPVFTVEADAVTVRFLAAKAYMSAMADAGLDPLPLPTEYTLSAAETTLLDESVDAFNGIIADAVAARPGVFLYDANAELAALTAEESTHFLVLAAQIGPEAAAATTLFSLDGIHPNNRGYGLVANGFLATMNAELGSAFPMVDTASLTWDPTYGAGAGEMKAIQRISVEAARAVDAIFQ